MNKKIIIEYNDEKYTLEYNRSSVVKMESNNFKLDDINNKPIEMITKLFDGAFYMHHPNIREDIKQEIYEQIPNKDQFIIKLSEMYSDTLTTLLGDSSEGKAKWEVNW